MLQEGPPPEGSALAYLADARAAGTITDADLCRTAGLLLIAGFETTVNLIGNAVHALHTPPAPGTPSSRPPTRPRPSWRTLRFDPPVQFTARVAREDMTSRSRCWQAVARPVLVTTRPRRPAVFANRVFDQRRAGATGAIWRSATASPAWA